MCTYGLQEGGTEGTYVYLWLVHIVVWQNPTKHYKAVILQLKINLKKILFYHTCALRGDFCKTFLP